jgi:DNA polymerase-3 subunit chi
MAEIGFYHLTRTGPDQALPALLGRTLKAGHRALVLCDPARVVALDSALWLCTDPDWLPHGTEATGDPDMQPIWLTHRDVAPGEDVPNGARYLFLLDGFGSTNLAAFERVFDLFDGGDESSVLRARERWKTAKAGGHALTYWQQTETGWAKK